jgi:hypothetical protein
VITHELNKGWVDQGPPVYQAPCKGEKSLVDESYVMFQSLVGKTTHCHMRLPCGIMFK